MLLLLGPTSTPFGGRIAHGYYTLALAPVVLDEVMNLGSFEMAVNYGVDKLRFPAPLPIGDRIRMRVALDAVEPIPGGAHAHIRAPQRRQASLRGPDSLPRVRRRDESG